jgi:Holliday junction resolvase
MRGATMQPEARLGHKIMDALRAHGAFVFKVHGSGLMMAGLPDLIVCYRGYFIGIEVKMPGNKASARQLFVHKQIRRAGGIVVVAYSMDDVDEALSQVPDHTPRADQ